MSRRWIRIAYTFTGVWKTWGMTVSQLVIRPRGNNEEWVCEGGRGEVTNRSGKGVMIMWMLIFTHPAHVRIEARCQGACGGVP